MEFISFIDEYQKVVVRYSNHTAMEVGKEVYTHQDVWERASCIAQSLCDLPKGSRVGLHIPKSFELVAAMLGCWMRGLIFIPLDPSLPPKRIEEYINDVQPHRILSHHNTDSIGQVISLKGSITPFSLPPIDPYDGAYILYSSGSTGRPKGILVPHRGLLSMLSQQISVLKLKPNDRCLWFLSMQFDASISDIGVSLLSGATLIIDQQENFLHTLNHNRISYVDMPPVLLGMYTPDQFPDSLRSILVGGEPCPHHALEKHRQHRQIVVVYGPTESTICTSLVVCDSQNSCIENSIGTPLNGVEYHLEQGELWIAGDLLALGYWNRPALKNKWIIHNQKRFFRTGDAVLLHNDEYQFVGRIDRQCKLHGKLIAPEEIEQALGLQHDVQRAYVCLYQHQLFAFIESTSITDYAQCIHHIQDTLPQWMIPKQGIILPQFPILPSGKIDHIKLQQIIPESNSKHFWCTLFAQVLHKPIQIHDNFFELGGDSISLMTLLVLAQQQSKQLTPEQLRVNPTPDKLSKMNQREVGRTVESLQRYVDKERTLLPSFLSQTSLQTIYITGATGFLGTRLLSIICSKGFRPRVLVRGTNRQHAIERLPEPYRKKVDVFVGDITQTESIEKFIGTGEGLLFHCAASLSLGASLDDLYSVNVHACTKLFSYPKLKIAYASTLAFLLTHNGNKGRIMEEPSNLAMNTRIFGGYSQSKWITEQLAISRQALIFRFGLLVDDKNLPRFDWFVSFIRGLAKLGSIPKGVQTSLFLDMTPLSYAAQTFVDIALQEPHGIYHVASSKRVSLELLCQALVSLGYPILECDIEDWFLHINNTKTDHEIHVVRLAFEAILNNKTITPQLNMFLATGSQFDDTQVQKTLGNRAPIPTLESIRSIVHFILESA